MQMTAMCKYIVYKGGKKSYQVSWIWTNDYKQSPKMLLSVVTTKITFKKVINYYTSSQWFAFYI